jgi:hypothetical protein
MQLNLSPSTVVPILFAVVATCWVVLLLTFLWSQSVALIELNKKIVIAHKKIAQLRALKKLTIPREVA